MSQSTATHETKHITNIRTLLERHTDPSLTISFSKGRFCRAIETFLGRMWDMDNVNLYMLRPILSLNSPVR